MPHTGNYGQPYGRLRQIPAAGGGTGLTVGNTGMPPWTQNMHYPPPGFSFAGQGEGAQPPPWQGFPGFGQRPGGMEQPRPWQGFSGFGQRPGGVEQPRPVPPPEIGPGGVRTPSPFFNQGRGFAEQPPGMGGLNPEIVQALTALVSAPAGGLGWGGQGGNVMMPQPGLRLPPGWGGGQQLVPPGLVMQVIPQILAALGR